MPSLSFVVVTHQSAAWLAPLAASFSGALWLASTPAPDLIIADAGSTDGTLQLTPTLFPTAQILALPNRGFGAAANAAIARVATDWILLCNADITFPPSFLQQAISLCDSAPESVALIAPQLRNPDQTVQPSIGPFPSITSLIRDQLRSRPLRKYLDPQPTKPMPIGGGPGGGWATAACLLLRRSAWHAVGGFDEKYFLYVEEVDLQRRLQDAGHQLYFQPALQVTHHNPNASRLANPDLQRYAARGTLRYFAKFGGGLTTYRLLALASGRLPPAEALASRRQILDRATSP